eukprot:CAMPEP_0174301094 /NCGR_PEP_ID=MMETSP0809-20121228/58844_1 /TAXON_ID=73025 ORGANISM="Eutreptiella gymnastica-like, Strain CCMP1594" /NCGR_SAMPLE_ID=MMETSP0809 /ASSEMBLY_ACC=CAM_ASM_000658 /LENGTH=425 /DNA_ID=CAMNT_0015406779 /DNA_START=21 /DNA_END=1298 /DNA_ORIENTATION=-
MTVSADCLHTSPRILCVGDSLTAGYHGSLTEYAPYANELSKHLGVEADDIGMSGWRCDEMVANANNDHNVDVFGKLARGVLHQLALQKYTTCIIMGGTNDLSAGRNADDIISDLQTLHGWCHARSIRTVALPIPESAFIYQPEWATMAATRVECNRRLQQWAASQPDKVLFVDMTSQVPFSIASGDWNPDGLHMSQLGYTRFGQILSAFIRDFVAASAITQLLSSSSIFTETSSAVLPVANSSVLSSVSPDASVLASVVSTTYSPMLTSSTISEADILDISGLTETSSSVLPVAASSMLSSVSPEASSSVLASVVSSYSPMLTSSTISKADTLDMSKLTCGWTLRLHNPSSVDAISPLNTPRLDATSQLTTTPLDATSKLSTTQLDAVSQLCGLSNWHYNANVAAYGGAFWQIGGHPLVEVSWRQ